MTWNKSKKIIAFLILFALLLGIVAEVVLWFYATPLVKKPLQQLVARQTDSLYRIEFSRIRINLVTRSFYLQDFTLVPDTLNPEKKNLLQLGLKEFRLERVRTLSFLLHKAIRIRRVVLNEPQVKFINYQPRIKKKTTTSVTYEVVKDQIIRQLLSFANEINIKEISITSGRLDFLREIKQHNFTARSITLVLHNFLVNKQSFWQKSLFASDFQIIMDNYTIQLGQSHVLQSDKLLISSRSKTITLSNTLLHPVRLNDTLPNFFVNVNQVILQGIDFQDIYLNNNLLVKKILINKPYITVYNLPAKKDSSKKFDIVGIIKKYFHTTAIDSLNVEKANIRLYTGIRSSVPIVDMRNASLSAYRLEVTPSSTSIKIGDITSHISSLATKVINRTHLLGLHEIDYHYKQQSLSIGSLTLLPLSHKTNSYLVNARLKKLKIKLLNQITTSKLIPALDLLSVGQGKVNITLLSPQKKKRKTKPLSLLVNLLHINDVHIVINNLVHKPQKISGTLSLTGTGLNISTARAKDEFLKFQRLKLLVKDFSQFNPDNIQNIGFDTLLVSTDQKKILLKSLHIDLNEKADSLLRIKHKSLIYQMNVPSVELTGIDISNALYNKTLLMQALVMNNPKIQLLSYPEIASDTFHIQIRKIIREKAVKEIVNQTSATIFDMYQSVQSFTDSTYKDFKHRSDLIDSLENMAINLIFDIHIPNSHINLQDTTAKNINHIYVTTVYAIHKIAFSTRPDSAFLQAFEKLIKIKQLSEKKFFNLQEIATALTGKFNLIKINNITLNNASLTLTQKYSDKQITIFHNLLTIGLSNFHLDQQYQQTCKGRLLCSDNIVIDVNRYKLNLPDSVHVLEFNHLDINSQDSTIVLSDIYVTADTTCPQAKKSHVYISSYIPNIILSQINIHKLLDSNILDINNIFVSKSFIHLKIKNNGSTKATQKRKITQNFLKKLIVHNIVAPRNIIRINTNKLNAYTVINLKSSNIQLDSTTQLTNLTGRTYSQLTFTSTRINLPDNKYLQTGTLYIDSRGQLWGKNISTHISDSSSFGLDSFYIQHLDINSLIKSKKLDISYLYLNHPLLLTTSQQKKTGQAKDITQIDAYSLVKKFLNSITIDTSYVSNLQINTANTQLNNLYLSIKKLNIDSTTHIDTPNLFYCQNIVLTIKNQNRHVSQFYSTGFSSLTADIQHKNIHIDSFYYSPLVTIPQFTSLIEWRKTYTDFKSKSIDIKGIDWIPLLKKESITAKLIKVKDFSLYAYIDRGIKHDYTDIKPHFVDLVLKSRIPLNIHDAILQNGNITYEEKAPDNKTPGHIELNDTYIVLSNLKTNLKPPAQIRLHLTGKLQHKSPVTLYGYFDPDTINYKFRLYGQLGYMQLSDLNPFLIYSANIKVNSGFLEKAEFLINGTDSIATGVFKATYHDLTIDVLKPGGEIQPQKRKFLSLAANIIARRNNPQLGLFYKIGLIGYIHDRSFSDIKFWIKALLSGVKSLILFENKKELKKIYRLKYGTSVILYL